MAASGSLLNRLALPIFVSVGIIAIGPFIRPLRDAVFGLLPGRGVTALTGILVVLAGCLMVLAVMRIDSHRGLRYLGLVLVLLALWAQAIGFRQDLHVSIRAQVELVERVHIILYGGLAVLLVRTFSPFGLVRAVTLPLVWASWVGAIDELVQFLVPSRTGEVRDVAINATAAATGVLFAVCLSPPVWRGFATTARPLSRSLAVLTLTLGGFVYVAHLGYLIDDPAVGRFRSWSTADELAAKAADRARQWQTATPPTGQELCCLQDYYLTEASRHNEHRNERFRAGDLIAAWHADNVLRAYYAPYLDKPLPPNGRLPRDEIDRNALEAAAGDRGPAGYESPVLRSRIWTRPNKPVWAAATLLAAACLWIIPGRTRERP